MRPPCALEAGTEVRFASTDAESDGQDDARVELIVENGGTLQAGAGEIIFRSSSDSPSASDWYGIRVESGGSADLSGATIQDAHRCVQSHDSPTTTPAPVTMSDATELTHCGLTVSLVPSPPRVGHPVSASVVDVTGTVTGNGSGSAGVARNPGRISPCLRARHVRRVNPAPCFRGCPCTRRCSPIGVRCCGSGCTIKTGRICTTTCTAP